MNSRTVKIVALPIAAVLALSAALASELHSSAGQSDTSSPGTGETVIQAAHVQQQEETAPDAGELYLLAAYGDYIAVYTPDSSEPYIITDIALSRLRENDRRMVERGIEAGTREELLSLLEDFGY